MCKALVFIGDYDGDHTRGLPRHGDVLHILEDDQEFGGRELDGRRVVHLPGPSGNWIHLLSRTPEVDMLPLFRNFYLDDSNQPQKRPTIPSTFALEENS